MHQMLSQQQQCLTERRHKKRPWPGLSANVIFKYLKNLIIIRAKIYRDISLFTAQYPTCLGKLLASCVSKIS